MPFSTPKYVEDGTYGFHHAHELAKSRRWIRIGGALLALLFTWNLVLSAKLVFPSEKEATLAPRISDGSNVLETLAVLPSSSDISLGYHNTRDMESLDVRSTSVTELQARDGDGLIFSQHTRLALTGVAAVGSLWAFGSTFIGLASDCKEALKSDGEKSKNQCFAGIYTNALAVVGAYTVARHWHIWGNFGTVLRWYYYPYEDTPVRRKRDMEDLSSLMTAAFGFDVQHIGDWDATNSNHLSVEKRSLAKAVPVFGFNNQGEDMHLALLPNDNNSTTFHMGRGPGRNTEANRKLRKREEVPGEITPFWDDAYFENGGIDFKVEYAPSFGGINPESIYVDSQDDVDWIRTQVDCYLDKLMPPQTGLPGLDDIIEFVGDYAAFRFAINNEVQLSSIAAGVIAPFTKDEGSAINEIDIDKGIQPDETCSGLGFWDGLDD